MNRIKKDWGVILLDIVAVNLSWFLALLFRIAVNGVGTLFGDAYSFPFYAKVWMWFAPIYTLLCLVIFNCFRLYGGVWAFAGRKTAYNVFFSWLVTVMLHIGGTMLLMTLTHYDANRMPLTYYVVGAPLQLLFVLIIRFARRVASIEKRRRVKKSGKAIIVGAGQLGLLAMQVLQDGENYDVCAIVDTQQEHVGLLIDGVPVYGLETLENLLDKNDIKCVFLAEPELTPADRMKIAAACRARDVGLRERASNDEVDLTEDQFVTPTTVMEGEWVERYKQQFGEGPSFF